PSITIDLTTPAVFTIDSTGSFSIVSDAQDMSTAPFRLWAAFMDSYERTVIYPDREFHNRLASTTGNVNETDPQKVNLATGTSYDGKPLCANQTQAQQMAQAVQQMTRAVGLGAGSTTVAHGFDANVFASGKYIAYPDLPGLSYL